MRRVTTLSLIKQDESNFKLLLTDNDYGGNNNTVEQTHFHAGEITAVSPSKPAAVGTLVNVHILQVDIHTHNAPARGKTGRERDIMR